MKWVFKKTMNTQGKIEWHKAWIFAKGYKQKERINYNIVFAHVARKEIIQLLISQVVLFKWTIFQMDVKLVFLDGVLEENINIEQSPGYIKVGKENKVLKLKKELYRLKQAPQAWNTRIDICFKENRFKQYPYKMPFM